jgi:hypothetical protein
MEQKWKQKPRTNDMEENCKCTPQSLTPYTPVNLPQTLTLCTRVSNPSDHKEVTVVINPLHSYLAPK